MSKFDYMLDEPDVKRERFSYMLEEEEEMGLLGKLPGLQIKRHVPLVGAIGDILKPKPRKQPTPIYERLRTIEPIPAPQATTEVVAPPQRPPSTIRPLTEGESAEEALWRRPQLTAQPPDFVEKFEKTTKNIYRGVKKGLQPGGDDPAVNAIKGVIGFYFGIPEFISEMGETALETISASTPEESARILKKKGGEMVAGAAHTLQNLAWLISYSISPVTGGSQEEYERRQGEFLQDPSAPVIAAWIVKAMGRGIGRIPKGKMAVKAKQIVDYVKSQDVLLKRQRGRETPVLPTEKVGVAKTPVPGEAELKVKEAVWQKAEQKLAEMEYGMQELTSMSPNKERMGVLRKHFPKLADALMVEDAGKINQQSRFAYTVIDGLKKEVETFRHDAEMAGQQKMMAEMEEAGRWVEEMQAKKSKAEPVTEPPVPGEAELKVARKLKEKGVTEKPAEIPKFKGTEEALEFGRLHAGNEAIRNQLIRLKEETGKKVDVLRKQKKFDEGMEVATEGQFYREALESMERPAEIPAEKVIPGITF